MLKGLTPLAIRLLVGLAVAALFALILLVQSCNATKTAKTKARLSENQTEAAIASGTDAVETLGQQGNREDAVDTITRDNDNAIRKAPGADAPVNSDLDSLARERLCRRTVYRVRPECLQYAPAE